MAPPRWRLISFVPSAWVIHSVLPTYRVVLVPLPSLSVRLYRGAVRPVLERGGVATFNDAQRFVKGAVGDGAAVPGEVVAVVVVGVGGRFRATDTGHRMGAGVAGAGAVAAAVAVAAHVRFAGDIAQRVVSDGFGRLARSRYKVLVAGQAVEAVVAEVLGQVFAAGPLLAAGQVAQAVPAVVQVLDLGAGQFVDSVDGFQAAAFAARSGG